MPAKRPTKRGPAIKAKRPTSRRKRLPTEGLPADARSPEKISAHQAQAAGAAVRRVRALDLRIEGKSYRAIGEALDVSHVQAREDVLAALDELAKIEHGKARVLRQLEKEQLDAATEIVLPKVRAGNLLAIDRLIRLSERRSKLLGLDAPTKVNHDVGDGARQALALLIGAKESEIGAALGEGDSDHAEP